MKARLNGKRTDVMETSGEQRILIVHMSQPVSCLVTVLRQKEMQA